MPDTKKAIEVSACIVTHNNSENIIPSLASIISKTRDVNLTIYISDNNSIDNTVEIISSEFPQVKIIQNEKNDGFGYGHNKMLSIINSDYHVVVNPDITFSDDAISYLVDKLENDNTVAIGTSKILNADGTEQHLPKKNPKFRYLIGGRFENLGAIFKRLREEYTLRSEKITEPLDIEFCTGCFFVIRTEIFKKLNGFDDRFFMYFEDADISRRAKKFGRVVFYPDVHVTHLWERASSKKLKFFLIQISSMFKYFFKWFGKKDK